MSDATKKAKIENFNQAEDEEMMSNIPDEIFVIIFKLLDNEAMKAAIQVCQRWRHIFATSKTLMEKFHVEVTSSNLTVFPFLGVPIRTLTLRDIIVQGLNSPDIDKFGLKIIVLMEFLENFTSSLENLNLCHVRFTYSEQFFGLLRNLEKLKYLEVDSCILTQPGNEQSSILPNLRSVSFRKSSPCFLTAFESFESLEKVKVFDDEWFDYASYCHPLKNLLQKVPSIQHLTLEGVRTASYFESGSFNFKIRKLDAFLTGFHWTHDVSRPRLSFFIAQKGHLKELKLTRLPYDYDGGEVLRFIFEEMNLKKFVYDNTTLIENSSKVEAIDEIHFMEFQVKSGLELLRQFPATKKLNLFLTRTGKSKTVEIFEPRMELLASIQEILVTDHSGNHNLLSYFTGLFMNCRNTKKMFLNTCSSDLDAVLREVLPYMTKLKEIQLSVELTEEIMQIIRQNCLNIEQIESTFQAVGYRRNRNSI